VTHRWAFVDARDPGAAAVLAGLPIFCRTLRVCARRGYAGAVVVVSEASRDAALAALAAWTPAGFAVEVTEDAAPDPARAFVPIDGRAHHEPADLAAATPGEAPRALLIRGEADAAEAERRLYRSLRKPITLDGAVAFHVMRPMSAAISRVLVGTRITPNQVTLAVLVAGLAGAFLAADGGYVACAVAGVLYWLGTVVDCVDGELARLRVQYSKAGEWLDTIADDVATHGLLAGLGVGIWLSGGDDRWIPVTVFACLAGLLVKAVMYWDMHRQGLPIDTADYKWWFGSPATPREQRGKGAFATFWYHLSFVFHRDGYGTLITLALLLGVPKVAAVGLILGTVLPGPLLILHFWIMSRRSAPAAVTT
jgi:phosphatidylglycerophosphate synthase